MTVKGCDGALLLDNVLIPQVCFEHGQTMVPFPIPYSKGAVKVNCCNTDNFKKDQTNAGKSAKTTQIWGSVLIVVLIFISSNTYN